MRVGELCELRVGDVRPSTTRAGPGSQSARLRALGLPSGPYAYLVPNRRGGRLSRGRAGQILAEAARLASERLAARGMPPLPHTTPHTLRRTYISIALIANEFDVKLVMSQVGHANSAMTMDVYVQLEQRAKRSHGASFDRLVEEAREQVAAAALVPCGVECNNVSK